MIDLPEGLLQRLVDNDRYLQALLVGSNHNYHCRCNDCLRWWLSVGPEDTGSDWSFGPFSVGEIVKAGGVVPPYPSLEDDNEPVAEVAEDDWVYVPPGDGWETCPF